MYHYYLSEQNGSFVCQGFVWSATELSQVLLDLCGDFPRLSSFLEDLSAIVETESEIFAEDVIKNEKLVLEFL